MDRKSGDINSPLSSSQRFTSNNSVAYVAQTPWLLNATIRDNILFGEEFDSARYELTLACCSLVSDLAVLPGGDLTEIGEKGINLSGGQKQRISLARACYSSAQYVLLDDTLSAVDAPTAKHILDHCILNILKGRTCILVTHNTGLVLGHADFILVVDKGQVVSQGSREQVLADPNAHAVCDLTFSGKDEDSSDPVLIEDAGRVKSAAQDGTGTTLVQAEEKVVGAVRLSLYKAYLIAAGGIGFAMLFFSSFFVSAFFGVVYDWWLKNWTDANTLFEAKEYAGMATRHIDSMRAGVSQRFYSSTPQTDMSMLNTATQPSGVAINPDALFYIGIYAFIGFLKLFVRNIQEAIVFLGAFRASKKLHALLLASILSSPLRFFETTPVGRILNRFSKDVDNLDSGLMFFIQNFVERVVAGLTILTVIATVSPRFLLIVAPTVFIYQQVAKKYLTTSRDLKRLESISKSPVYAQFSETLQGAATIRAYASSVRFRREMWKKIDLNHQSFFYIWATNRWLCLRIDFISAAVVLSAGVAVVMATGDPGLTALTLTYAMQFTHALLWTVRLHAEMEMAMNSMERIGEYTQLDQEPPMHIELKCPPKEWPQHGYLEVNGLSLRYAPDLPDVLHNVSFCVQAGKRLAVVGRTGAGKSTLSTAFFRMMPFSSGSIVIDGVDICEIGLHDLRSRLTIIPQDPVLFSGTIRSNLDPFGEHSDQDMHESLGRVGYDAGMLDSAVSENGANFSQGQCQLLCLARALLRQTRIVFLDEATASVDHQTDQRIQETLRRVDATVVCIAHRLETIMDYDQVLVLDMGRVAEIGSPRDLIQRGGQFRDMCRDASLDLESFSLV